MIKRKKIIVQSRKILSLKADDLRTLEKKLELPGFRAEHMGSFIY